MAEVARRVHDEHGVWLHAETCLIGFPDGGDDTEVARS